MLEGARADRANADHTGMARVRTFRDEILRIAERRNASHIRVFGSVARGEDTEESDFDFVVRMAPDATLVDLIGLEQDLAALLGRKVDVVTDDALSPRMSDEVGSTAVHL